MFYKYLKTTSNEVTEQLEIGLQEETEIQIDAARQGYRPISVRAALLYFILSDLAAVDPMYQFSLQAYVTLFLQSITNSRDKSGIVPELPLRLREIIDFHTLQVYKTTCLGLLRASQTAVVISNVYQNIVKRFENSKT